MEVAAGEIEAWGFPSLVQFDWGIRWQRSLAGGLLVGDGQHRSEEEEIWEPCGSQNTAGSEKY
jgi:hypothetical protein